MPLKKILLFILGIVLVVAGCRDDLDTLRRDLDEQVKRLEALEAKMSELNSNISALQLLVEALKTGKQITSVSETWDGYTLTFSDQSTIKIYNGLNGTNGTDGTDGAVVLPSVSVRDSTDGHTYWTVDGRLLLNDSGKPVRADGDKGESGTPGPAGMPGITPKIRIHPATNEWEISVDGGASWTTTGIKATGAPGDTGQPGADGTPGAPGDIVFARDGVDIQEEYVEFTLRDGTRFRVPRYTGLALYFPQGADYRMPRGVEKLIPFKITGTSSSFTVNAAGSNGWQAEVRMAVGRPDSGVITVTVPPAAGTGSVIVLLDDGRGACRTYRLGMKSLPTGKMLPVGGGSLSIIGSQGEGWSVSDFWLGETEVTCQQYCDFLNDLNPVPTDKEITFQQSIRDTSWWLDIRVQKMLVYLDGRWSPNKFTIYYASGNRVEDCGNYPIANLTWYGARAYCRWAGASLPTGAQWEYAARGGAGNPNASTQIYSGSNNPDEVAWHVDNSLRDGYIIWPGGWPKGVHRVGKKTSNYLGFYDMTGNVREWCKDYADGGEIIFLPENGLSGQEDPQGPKVGEYRLVRGGDYYGLKITCKIDYLWHPYPEYAIYYILGFRPAFNPRQ